MARERQVARLELGEHTGTAFWRTGRGIEERERYAEGIRIAVTEKWVYLHLVSGEVVRLRRSGGAANESAQIYVGMTVEQALREKAANYCGQMLGVWEAIPPEEEVEGGPWRRLATKGPAEEDIEKQMALRRERLIADADWPAVLAQRRIGAVKAQEELERRAREREAAKKTGMAEWRSCDGQWLIRVDGKQEGDVVTVRRKDGTASRHVLGKEQGKGLYLSAGELTEEAPAEEPAVKASEALVEQGMGLYRKLDQGGGAQ